MAIVGYVKVDEVLERREKSIKISIDGTQAFWPLSQIEENPNRPNEFGLQSFLYSRVKKAHPESIL